jgi:hypothetical protein
MRPAFKATPDARMPHDQLRSSGFPFCARSPFKTQKRLHRIDDHSSSEGAS